MMSCDRIQEALAAGETLTNEQRDHLATCRDCRSHRAAIETMLSVAATVRSLSEPSAEEVREVQRAVLRRTRPHITGFRLVWAGAAMTLGILLVIAVLTNTTGPDPIDRSEERLIALLDEVTEIADPYEESSVATQDDGGLYLANVLLEDDTQADTDLSLPESYQLLEQALENDWL